MKNLFSAILNELKQHWGLFTVILLFLWIVSYKMSQQYDATYLFALVILCCYIPVAIAPNLLPDPLKQNSQAKLYQNKFISFTISTWQFLLLFAAGIYFWMLSISILLSFIPINAEWWCNILFTVLITLLYIALIVWIMRKKLTPFSPGIFYWAKFIAGLIPFLILTQFPLNFIEYNPCRNDADLLAPGLIIGVCPGIYVLIFFISVMMPKTRRPVVFVMVLLITLLLFLLLVPGIMGGTALFGTDSFIQDAIEKITYWSSYKEEHYAGSSGSLVSLAMFPFSLLCIVFLPALGYLLWTKRIIPRKKYLKSLFFGLSLLVLASFVLCIIAQSAGQSKLLQAKRDAESIGLLNESGQVLPLLNLPSVPAERNAARLYYKAFKLNGNNRWYGYRNESISSTVYCLRYEGKRMSQVDRPSLIEFIQSPDCLHVHNLLDQAAEFPECSFIPQIKSRGINLFADEMATLAGFIQIHVYAYKFAGQENKILPEIEKSIRIGKLIGNEQFWYSFTRSQSIIEDAMRDAIKIGPENIDAVPEYRKMLDYLAQRKINYLTNNLEFRYDYFSKVLNFQCCFDNGEWRRYSLGQAVLWADLIVGYPLVLRYFADYIDNSVKVRREMLKIRNMPVLPEEFRSLLLRDENFRTDYNQLLIRDISALFQSRSTQTMLKIGLALKIYKCEHGKYPASLQELVPAILSSVPVDPLDGKPFGYKVKNDHFFITSELNRSRTLSSESLEK